jgi:quercetin dioxygenase-like cupin family protein
MIRLACIAAVGCTTVLSALPVLQTRAEVQRFPQFDNDHATAWKSVIPAHSQSTMHRHDHFRALIALTGGELKTVTADGQTNVTALEKGKAYWFAPMPPGVTHRDVNDTDQTIEVVVVEVK